MAWRDVSLVAAMKVDVDLTYQPRVQAAVLDLTSHLRRLSVQAVVLGPAAVSPPCKRVVCLVCGKIESAHAAKRVDARRCALLQRRTAGHVARNLKLHVTYQTCKAARALDNREVGALRIHL